MWKYKENIINDVPERAALQQNNEIIFSDNFSDANIIDKVAKTNSSDEKI